MYETDDPRSRLDTAAAAKRTTPVAAGFAGAEYARFHDEPPHASLPGADTWYARGQNFVVSYSRVKPGAVLERSAQPDEYMLVLPFAGAGVGVETDGETVDVAGYSLVVLPPGRSRITVRQDTPLLRVFSSRNEDVAALASNAANYADAHPHIPAYAPWPAPPAGWRVRAYSLDVPPQPGRFGRIFRCTTMMINVLPFEPSPRDVTKLSPHHHEDFEQGSFALEGAFVHHIRWPWTANSRHWRADDHERCAAPSLCVIPPPAIHTSAATEPERNQLIDIFAPPRFDFSKQPGWVLNAADYPMPSGPA